MNDSTIRQGAGLLAWLALVFLAAWAGSIVAMDAPDFYAALTWSTRRANPLLLG